MVTVSNLLRSDIFCLLVERCYPIARKEFRLNINYEKIFPKCAKIYQNFRIIIFTDY